MTSSLDINAACSERGFLPVHGESVEVLILGSFPSRQSLEKKEYYGNPQNHFWHIIEALYDIDRHLPYAVRIFTVDRASDRTLGYSFRMLPRW